MSAPVQKITFAEMRAAGVRGVLIYCSDYRCSHSTCLDADRWADDIRLSDIGGRFRLHRLRSPWSPLWAHERTLTERRIVRPGSNPFVAATGGKADVLRAGHF